MRNIVIQAWVLYRFNNKYYIPYTHWIYLKEICKYYEQVCLLSPVIDISTKADLHKLLGLDVFNNIVIHKLPASKSYIGAVKYFFYYLKAYKNLASYEYSYVRYPVPFGWLQRLYMKGKRIIHYVGDPIDTIKKNGQLPFFKKILYIMFFLPEHFLYMWASKGDVNIFTNGQHLAKKLSTYGVKAKTLISSTLSQEDFFLNSSKNISKIAPKLIYIGYLRKAKGVETVLRSFQFLLKTIPDSTLTLVGSGELEHELKNFIAKNNISNVYFLGHVDDRQQLNEVLRGSDIFCFASVSEGSPRVILEAMANGVNIVSTPVGSLPYVFSDEKDILFANFDDPNDFKEKIEKVIYEPEFSQSLRNSAYQKVSSMTIEKFIQEIFYAT